MLGGFVLGVAEILSVALLLLDSPVSRWNSFCHSYISFTHQAFRNYGSEGEIQYEPEEKNHSEFWFIIEAVSSSLSSSFFPGLSTDI